MSDVEYSASDRSHPSPNFDHLRKQAKALARDVRRGDAAALGRVAAIYKNPPQLDTFPLAGAQFVIARELGFASWPKLKMALTSTEAKTAMRPFNSELGYYKDRALGLMSMLASGLPEAYAEIRRYDARFALLSDEKIGQQFSEADARAMIAREHGNRSWDEFEARIESIAAHPTRETFLQAFRALEAGDDRDFAKLLEGDPALVNALGTNNNTLLNLACACRRPAVVRWLLARGADPRISNIRGWTPLHQAADSNLPNTIRDLIRAGAITNVNALGDGGTPLVAALFWGNVESAELLAEHGLVPRNLRTAAAMGRLDVLASYFNGRGRIVPEAGAHRAFYRPHSGFPIWHPTDSPQEILDEALTYAARNGRIEAMAFLIARGANIDADPYRGTPLTWAAFSKKVDAVRWLLANGADVNCRATFGGLLNGQGITAAHISAQAGCVESVDALLEGGADPYIKDELYGGTVFSWARQGGHPDIVNAIERHGFDEARGG